MTVARLIRFTTGRGFTSTSLLESRSTGGQLQRHLTSPNNSKRHLTATALTPDERKASINKLSGDVPELFAWREVSEECDADHWLMVLASCVVQ